MLKINPIGFGTFPLVGEECTKAVISALKLGANVIDTATYYANFDAIARAIALFDRKKIYLISKVWPDSQKPDQLQRDIANTLNALQTDYLDNYLLHWPDSRIPIEPTLTTMEEFKKKGIVRYVGASNVTINHLKRIADLGFKIDSVQVEMNPIFYDPKLLSYCHRNNIRVQAWAPLARGRINNNTLLTKIGKKYHKNNAQIALRWIIQHNCIALPGSKNVEHQKQNLDIMDFSLTNDEMNQINVVAKKGERERVTADLNLGFLDEFDYSYEQCWPTKNPIVNRP